MVNKLSAINIILYYTLSVFLIFLIFSCTSQTRKDFDAYVTYYNNHDFMQRMTLYSDTAKFELINGWLKIGKDKIGKYEEFMNAVESTISASDVKIEGDTLYCTLTEQDKFRELLGVDKLVYQTRYIIRNGLITEVVYSLTPESGQLLSTASKPFTQWVSENHRADWDELINKTGFIYNKDTAGKWLDLARRWQKEKNQDK
ncbi:MAG: hypothetical protein P8Y60_15340 [Calditrichota bacterium]